MTRFRAAYGRLLEWLVVVLMIILFVEVTVGVVFRFIGHSLAWYDELASHLLAWLTFYGAALASVKRAHIGCPEVVEMMPWRTRRLVNIVAQLIVIAFFVMLGSVGAWISPVLATDALISLPEIPMNVVESVIPISSLLIVIAEVGYLLELIAAKNPPRSGRGAALADELQ
jgi:TRAP-type C4-dicarboxylate transport system permease small subunit